MVRCRSGGLGRYDHRRLGGVADHERHAALGTGEIGALAPVTVGARRLFEAAFVVTDGTVKCEGHPWVTSSTRRGVEPSHARTRSGASAGGRSACPEDSHNGRATRVVEPVVADFGGKAPACGDPWDDPDVADVANTPEE